MKKRHHWWIKAFLGLVLAIGCILQIQISLDKYMSVKTTLARYQRKQGKAPLPTTILCPHNPYRQSRIMEDNNMTVFTDMDRFGKWPSNESQVESAWENTTFGLEELIDRIYAKVNGSQCLWKMGRRNSKCRCIDKSTQKPIDLCYINIQKLDTLFNGRCYVFNLSQNVSAYNENMYFVFKHEKEQESGPPLVFVGAKFPLTLSVVSMLWNKDPFAVVQPKMHEETNVMSVPSERIQKDREEEEGCRDKNDLEDCVLSKAESNMYNSSFAMLFCGPDAFGNCTIPQASFLAPKRPNTHYCQDEITAGCAHMIVKETLRNFVSGHYQAECTKPCVQPQYKLSQFALNMWPRKVQNTSRLFLYLKTTNVEVEEEYLLYDLNVFLASIGGSFGLFLGFSFYQVALYGLKYATRRRPKVRVVR